MDEIRARGLAKECGVSNDELIAKAKSLGIRIDSPASVLRDNDAGAIRDAFGVVDVALKIRRTSFPLNNEGMRASEFWEPESKPNTNKPKPKSKAGGSDHLYRTGSPERTEPYSPPKDAEPLTFRFYFDLRYSKAVDPFKDDIINNFGALAFKTGGRVYEVLFDGLDYGKESGTPDDVIEYGFKNPIVPEPEDEEYPDLFELTFEAIANIEDIEIRIEEVPDESLLPVEVVSGGFTNPYDYQNGRYPLSAELLKKLNKRIAQDWG